MGADGTLSSNQSSRSRYNIGALIYSLRNSSGIARVAQAALESCRSLEHRDLLMDLDQDAQDTSEVNVLKGRIWEAEAAQRNFSAGLPHCRELNGTNFYFYPGNRVLNLQDYRRSLDNLVAEGAFNAETRRPWIRQDAEARWAQVQKQATTDQAHCAAVANLPSLRQKLKELEQRQ